MPHPIDVMVGKRIRLRRVQLGLSQQSWPRTGVTFQQVQKSKTAQSRELQPALRDIGCVGSADRFFLHGLGARRP